MEIYHFNPVSGLLVGVGSADQDPLDKSNWLVPAFATEQTPLEPADGKTVNFVNGAWSYVDIPPAPAPEPPVPPAPPAPLTATPYQFKAALVKTGLYANALAAVNAGDVLTQLAWAEAQVFIETDALIVAMATALGKTSDDVHSLFQLAGTLAP